MKRSMSLRAFLLVALLMPLATIAQNPDSLIWKKKLNFAVNFNQASFSSNWKAGGVNSIGFNSLFNYKANYKRERASWDNEIDLAFGFVNNSGQGYRKTLDRLYLDTKYGYELSKNWGLFTSLNLLTQFAKGYNYLDDNTSQLISDSFAPAFITSAWGLEYHPLEYFKVRFSPFAPRVTIVRDPTRFTKSVGPEPYGVDSTKTARFEWLAFQMLAEFNKEIAPNVNLKWRYLLYANYETLDLKTIDHRIDLDIVAKVNKYINVSIGGILLYDYDQDLGVQLSQVFSLGFLYNFQNYEEPKKP
ncbi:DUF3078 domain-containing protein [Fulvivirgaceae bacterium PWU4]|uniref:DUF3078 domain-containing protein n=1 Tax=Chryseosolibacter histidini TaxID=2782349 RepID=A0AAP2DIT3_9BACT|nr:DUF3078 domain-containing protein [Chryseosolibacter histidini]MBT1696349.1 DUF3078 domain-containing protein [Chryseosolibacter histidini]